MKTTTVLFDLDGTLLDTAQDLSQALNRILLADQKTALPFEKLRNHAGKGSKGLLKVGLNLDENHDEYPEKVEAFLNYYQEHFLESTRLFDGMQEVLNYLNTHQYKWGIVTNKPEAFTNPLIKHLNLHCECVVSGDTLSKRKPDPMPLLYACDLLKSDPSECIYIGDSAIDIIASRAAGMPVLAALYGYISEDENPQLWNADAYIRHPEEIISWLESR